MRYKQDLWIVKPRNCASESSDRVYANIGEFTEGKILKCWDQGNPYRVEIQNEEKTNVWVPVDNDNYVIEMI